MAERKYRGVSYNRITGLYHATVSKNRIKYNCGAHSSSIEAAKARDIKILEKGLGTALQVLKSLKK